MTSLREPDSLQSLEDLERIEWLETNGVGGWASAAVSGANTRRYHGLLVAAAKPPVRRFVLLSKLEETIVTAENRHQLGCNHFGDIVAPDGYKCMRSFQRGIFPVFEYQAGGIALKKTVAAINGQNITVVTYEVISAESSFTLELRPFVAARDYHNTTHANAQINPTAVFEDSLLTAAPYPGVPELYISVPGCTFVNEGNWYYNFNLTEEKARGLDHTEDLYVYGVIRRELAYGDRFAVVISADFPVITDGFELIAAEEQRRRGLLKAAGSDEFKARLLLAADQFLVRRDTGESTIIAGYHWFTDWGRDTMIALPGICLATGRFDEARSILELFAGAASEGMLPNRFADDGSGPEYNTVDAALWYVVAAGKYLAYTGDLKFVEQVLYPLVQEIIAWHERGTRFGIKVDFDGLVSAGAPGTQLTWMDVKIGRLSVTPRHGKAVEINALWCNALEIAADFAASLGRPGEASKYRDKADKAKASFRTVFWNADSQSLYDCICAGKPDRSVRPNQLIALSLPCELVTAPQALSVLRLIDSELLTPVGLRSLARSDPRYRGKYAGGPESRDGSYHQGTVWSWLLGPYITAVRRYRKSSPAELFKILDGIKQQLNQACVGSISEIFDGDAPHLPRGCVAQAWSVGEILRAYVEDILAAGPVMG